ncbi:RnfH family protein [Magnetococcales bacterium HHB-1]
MQVAVTYAEPHRQVLLEFDIPEGATAQEAIERSGILRKFPKVDLSKNKIGIYGKLAKPDQVLSDGDRVEIYRPALGKPPKKKRAAGKAGGAAAAKARVAAAKKKAAAAKAKGGEKAADSLDEKKARVQAAKERAAAAKAKLAAKKAGGGDAPDDDKAARIKAAKERAAAAKAKLAAKKAAENG